VTSQLLQQSGLRVLIERTNSTGCGPPYKFKHDACQHQQQYSKGPAVRAHSWKVLQREMKLQFGMGIMVV